MGEKPRWTLSPGAWERRGTIRAPRSRISSARSTVPRKKAFDAIKANATTAADATNLWTGGFERPKVNNSNQRYVRGSQAGRLDADGNPIWTTGPAAPLPAAGSVPTQGPNQPTPADTRSAAQKFADAAKKGDVGGALAALGSGEDEKGKETGWACLATQPSRRRGQRPRLRSLPPASERARQPGAAGRRLGRLCWVN